MTERGLLEGKRVLIVDDEPDVLDSLEQLLDMCDLVKARTFEDAKEKLETQDFDIAILDIMGVNGYKLLQIANDRKVLAVMLTAHAMSPDDISRSFKNGAAWYMPKDEMVNTPIYLNDILEAEQEGKSFWWRWNERLISYFDKRFGPDWQKRHRITVR